MTKEKEPKKKFKFNRVLSIITILTSIYLIYNILLLGPIEKLIRYILIGIIIFINIIFLLCSFKCRNKLKNVILTIIMIISIIFNIFIGFNINKVYSAISSVNKDYITYSSSLVTLKSSNIDTIKDIDDKKLGIINDKESIDGYVLAHEIINENKLDDNNNIEEYDNYTTMINDLYDKKLDAVFLPTNYEAMFSSVEGLESISDETKIITSKERKEDKKESNLLSSNKKVDEPFTILLMGVDSTKDGLSNSDSFNGDSLMLVTFNPKTLNATILSIPRDTYVPIMCFPGQYENKITHSAWKGTSCVVDTIENFLDIKIDYYMKINFTGLVDLVDAVGGVTVDVPYSFCEQDSKRRFGSHTLYVKKGTQKLNGEQALALSRNRKTHANKCSSEWTKGTRDDFVRGKNQQLVVQGLVNEIKNLNNINKIYDILDVISKNLDTNMSTETILSFYNILKDIMMKNSDSDELVSIQTLSLSGYGQMIYDESTRLVLWNYIPNKPSVEDIKKAMKVNLELESYTMDKDFSFSISEKYEKQIIGSGPYSSYTTYELVPDFTRYTKQEAINWGYKNGVTIHVNEVSKSSKYYYNGQIIGQSQPAKKRVDKLSGSITIDVVNKTGNSIYNKN